MFKTQRKQTQLFSVVRNSKGQALTEYITLLILVALVAVGGAKHLGKDIRSKIQTAKDHVHKDINFNDVTDK